MIVQAEGDSDVMIDMACKASGDEISWTKNIQGLHVCDVWQKQKNRLCKEK